MIQSFGLAAEDGQPYLNNYNQRNPHMKSKLSQVFFLALLVIFLNGVTTNASRKVSLCSAGDLVVRNADNNGTTCEETYYPFPSGTLLTFSSGSSCPAGFTEDTSFSGRIMLATTIASSDVGSTGGNSSITPAGTVSTPNFTGSSQAFTTTNALTGLTPVLVSPTSITPAGSVSTPIFSGTAFDPLPLYKKVIVCKRD